MDKPTVFLSYSHADELWKDRLLAHLRMFERSGRIAIWIPDNIAAGSEWSDEIEKAIARAHVAVLLVSPSFLASDFISQRELPTLMQRRQAQGLPVLPLVVSATYWSAIPELAALRFFEDGKPLSDFTQPEIDRILASAAKQIVEVATAVFNGQPGDPQLSTKSQLSPRRSQGKTGKYFISHTENDGDFAELLKLRLEKAGLDAWLDTDRLAPGVDWQLEIDDAIRSSPALIVVMSPEARASEYVTYEWAFAWGCGKKIIPLMLRQTPLHPKLATLQFLNFSDRATRPWGKLLMAL